MQLSRLIYHSLKSPMLKAVDHNREIGKILQRSRRYNAEHCLSGVLVEGDDFFLQILEGDRRALSDLMSQLFVDPRHRDIAIIEFKPIDGRTFSDWSMEHVLNDHTFGRLVRTQYLSAQDPQCVLDPDSIVKVLRFSLENDRAQAAA